MAKTGLPLDNRIVIRQIPSLCDCDEHILLEQIRTIDKKRLREHIGMLDSQQILTADNALLVSLGLDKKD